MSNFTRALKLAVRYKWTLAALIFSAVAVAVLWTANLGTVYPIVGVVLKQRSLKDWVDEGIQSAEQRSSEHEALLVDFDRQLGLESNPQKQRRLRYEQSKSRATIRVEQRALGWYRWARPWLYRFPDKPFPTLVIVVGFLMVGTALKTVFLVISVILVERLAQLASFDLRRRLYAKTIGMNVAQFGEEHTATLLSHFTFDLECITVGVRTVFGRAIREPLKIIACLIGAAFVSWRLLLFCLVVTPVAIYAINRLAKSVKRANRRAMDEMSEVYNHLSESFSGIRLIKAFTMERHERRRLHAHSKSYFRKAMSIAVYNSFTKPCTELMSIGVVCLAILTGGYLVLNQETHLGWFRMSDRPMDFESLMTFFALLSGVSDPFRKLAEVYNKIQRGSAAADRVYDLIDRQPSVTSAANAIKEIPALTELEFSSVDFAYEPGNNVIENVDLKVRAGECIAVVGSNGCGKSSLLSLIPRFYDPVAGSLTWNGHDFRDLHLRELRRKIGIVSQRTLLFDDTVLNNIRYGATLATEQQVVEAAKKARADEFIMTKLSRGYETQVGQSGALLSGGQRQRIALARAILRDPEILILDEATSQIDVESEQLIHHALEQFLKNRTTFMITHRLSSLTLADRIVVMDAGKVTDVGAHNELMVRCPIYKRLQHMDLRASA